MAAAPVGISEPGAAPNPYANYGFPVFGPEFVGRHDHIRSIRSRTFTSLEAASISIVGPPRVGKSSLARHVIDRFATGGNARGLIFVPVWITVSGTESEQSLFRDLAAIVRGWLAEHGSHGDRLESAYQALAVSATWDDMRICLKTYLRQLRRSGYQVVAVLDEFDAARNTFTRSAPFELLRSIAYEPEIRVALITTSRRMLSEIVQRSTAELSTFPQIFGLPVILGCFSEAELTALIARSPYQDEWLRQALLAWLLPETGGQPFLSSALLSVLHDQWAADGPPVSPCEAETQFSDAVATCGQLIVDHHEKMLELLREEGRLVKLLEVLFGPQETAGPLDAERMAREGILKKADDGWAAFSESFHQYLSLLEGTRTSDNWRLWQRTETGLRTALATALESAYGDLWQIKLKDSQPRLIQKCEDRREHARRAFPDLAPDDNLLEYTYPQDLLDIMMMHWDQVAPAFGHSKEDWRQRVELVAKMRTPVAHNRRTGTSPLSTEQFRSACREILEWLPVTAS
jgi:hypothetical protein